MKEGKSKYEGAKILYRVSRIVSSSLDLAKVADLVLKESMEALDSDHASLFLLDENSGRLMLARARGFNKDQVGNIKLLGSWEVINDLLVKRRKPFIVNDIAKDTLFADRILPFSKERLPIKSFLAVPLKKEHAIIGALIVSNRKRPGHLFTKKDEELLLTLSNNIALALFNAKLYQDLKNLLISTVKSLVRAIEAKDPYTSGHSERVMKYAMAIARELKLDEDALSNLKLSGLLHDVGKIGIKEKILLKPARLSMREKKQMDLHPAIGARIVESIDNAHKIIRGILEHHERFDGRGYPNSLKGKRISLEGRIIAVADAFDALTTNRPYQRKFTSKEAFFEIVKGSTIQFDPKVVKAFMISFSRHPDSWKT
ncbi:MAG: HD domain-containing protein [Candidatus Omnitrophica bacterium]|nr:HD domain-containing protein [Candidatus Omnitrophota bacterium]